MSRSVPKEIRDRIQKKIWDKADELGWSRLSDSDRTLWYENWSKDKDIGVALAHFMDPRQVRVYIKDSLLKPYLRNRLEDAAGKVFSIVGLGPHSAPVSKTYDKPHGRLLSDGKIICWGSSRDWKIVIISVFERSYYLSNGDPYGAVLLENGRTQNESVRKMICAIGGELGIRYIRWID